MQILLFSDLHDTLQESVLRSCLSSLPNPDLVITLGDLSLSDLFTIKKCLPLHPIYGIRGNHDGPDLLDLADIKNFHGRTFSCEDISFVGFEGSVKFDTPTQLKQGDSWVCDRCSPNRQVFHSLTKRYFGCVPP